MTPSSGVLSVMTVETAKAHILIIADDPLMRRLLSVMLDHPNVTLSATECPEEALVLAQRLRLHAVILDTRGLRVNCVELCQRLKSASRDTQAALVVFVTDPHLCPDLVAAGVDAVFLKPFRVREVLRRLAELLRTSGLTNIFPLY